MYLDVEARILPVSRGSNYRLDPELVREKVDENTIGVFVILGSTYTGHYEPVEEISEILDAYQAKTGHDIPIHVDAASGGFVAPFTYAGAGRNRKWNFELPRVKSINASGHKYGLVYPGVGWIVWRDRSYLPDHLVFELHYLGGKEESYTLNFSRPGAQVAVQYYNLIHLGFSGYREIMENCLSNARLLSNALEATGWFTCVSECHRKVSAADMEKAATSDGTSDPNVNAAIDEAVDGEEEPAQSRTGQLIAGVKSRVMTAAGAAADAAKGTVAIASEHTSAGYVASLPVVVFRLSDDFQKEFPHIQQKTLSLLLRSRQWIVPNYSLPPGEDDIEIMRIVIRESMSFDLLNRLINDICQVTQSLIESDEVDLSILQKQKHGVELKSGKQGDETKPEHGGDGGPRSKREKVAEEVKAMSEGIHRSVC